MNGKDYSVTEILIEVGRHMLYKYNFEIIQQIVREIIVVVNQFIELI
jgi:hypothetical protein